MLENWIKPKAITSHKRNRWLVEDELGKERYIDAALLTVVEPGFWARAGALYEQNSKVRLVLWMSILLTALFGSISTMLLTTFLAG